MTMTLTIMLTLKMTGNVFMTTDTEITGIWLMLFIIISIILFFYNYILSRAYIINYNVILIMDWGDDYIYCKYIVLC